MTTELTGLHDDPRVRQAISDWTNDLLRLRSRPVRLGFQRGARSCFSAGTATMAGRPVSVAPLGSVATG